MLLGHTYSIRWEGRRGQASEYLGRLCGMQEPQLRMTLTAPTSNHAERQPSDDIWLGMLCSAVVDLRKPDTALGDTLFHDECERMGPHGDA